MKNESAIKDSEPENIPPAISTKILSKDKEIKILIFSAVNYSGYVVFEFELNDEFASFSLFPKITN